MKEATLCLLIKGDRPEKEILLAMKKKGFGAGKWNGVGGKLDPEKGDGSVVETAIREVGEEIGIKVKEIEKVAVLSFYYPYFSDTEEKEWKTHVFFAKNWEGEPRESEEMLPKWFKTTKIPFEQMWDDDKFWLPKILAGKRLKANFLFEKGEKVTNHDIKFVRNL